MDGTVSPRDPVRETSKGYLKPGWTLPRLRGVSGDELSTPRSLARSLPSLSPRSVTFEVPEGTDEPEVQRVSSAPELAERGEREKDAEELEFHKHKKNVNFGYRYSIVMGCGEFSVGRRVSEVERVKQNQRRHRWLQECRRLGDGDSNGPYDSDQDSVADGTLGDESGTDTECVEKPTRRRSRSDYNAEVFENMQDSGDGAGLEGSEQSASEEKPENPARQRWAERGRAQTSLEIVPESFRRGRRRGYTADVF
mmetsp:Transcript_11223/g.24776  ORF Transcript_11223/g.24776 Transcript_11223/m.24776 type:complete len:253 (-) Transcript_11223:49-807(-)